MNIIITIFIFLLALCIYIYLMHQYKKSEDLEVYEMDYYNNAHLQEICDVRQPIIFDFRPVCASIGTEISPQNLAKYSGQLVEIKDIRDYFGDGVLASTDGVSMALGSAKQVCDSDNEARYFSENNGAFLETSGINGRLAEVDTLLRPTFTISTKHDLLFGSPDVRTPLQYHTYYRRFLCVSLGKVRIKMLPWKASSYLNPIHDYEHYEFRSATLPSALTTDTLEFDVYAGSILFIPPYWWYSIQYSADAPETLLYSVSYMTVMNMVSNLPNLGLYWLQQQNIRPKISKIIQETEGTEGTQGKKESPQSEIPKPEEPRLESDESQDPTQVDIDKPVSDNLESTKSKNIDTKEELISLDNI